jgi:hypothetical protein
MRPAVIDQVITAVISVWLLAAGFNPIIAFLLFASVHGIGVALSIVPASRWIRIELPRLLEGS